MTHTFPRRTVTIDDVSEPGSWAAALADRAVERSDEVIWTFAEIAEHSFAAKAASLNGRGLSQRDQPAPNIPPSNKPTNQHGEAS